MRLAIAPVMLKFRFPAGTSRGVLHEKPTYLLKLWDERNPSHYGIGEASVFPGLSPEADGRYEYKLVELLANIALGRPTDLTRYTSIQLGLEEAIRDFSSGGKGVYFDTPFTRGEQQLVINGLVWMGNFEEMWKRAEKKLDEGFKCIKIKIGALDWKGELDFLKKLRGFAPADKLMIRVDANGGFSPEEAMDRLEQLALLDIHSIEQPIKAGQPEAMTRLCKESPVPIALDEELIGKYTSEEREQLLDTINPAYIILKPTLCGAFSGSCDWIEKAEQRNIGWWITSALESNVGLDAIAQFAASLNVTGPQGLGTGGLFVDNFVTPLYLDGEHLGRKKDETTDRLQFEKLDWKE